MKTTKNMKFLPLVIVIICCSILNCCESGNGDPDPVETDPKEESVPTEEEMLAVLRESGRYEVGEHSCMVEVSTDSYEYPSDGSEDYQVPVGLIDSMSTLGLIETILENSHFPTHGGSMLEIEEAIYYFSINKPGLLEELYSRADVASVLIERYLGMYYTCTDNNYSSNLGKGTPGEYEFPEDQLYFAFNRIHTLILQYEILYRATEEEIDSLSVHLIRTYLSCAMWEDDTFRSYANAGVTGIGLAARIMLCREYGPFLDLVENDDSFNHIHYLNSPNFISGEMRAKYMLLFNDFINERLE